MPKHSDPQTQFDEDLAREQKELERPRLTLRLSRVTEDTERGTITGEFDAVSKDAVDADFRVIDPAEETGEARKQLLGTEKESVQMSEYQDKTIVCDGCGQDFTWSASDQSFYAEKDFSPPKRCKPCRDKRKAERQARGGDRQGSSSRR